jgi:hypothetical protein
MTKGFHPYQGRPDYAYWRRAVSEAEEGELDPCVDPAFRIGARKRVATAGSCFAQHIGRYLKAAGSNYLVTEPPHPLLTEQAARVTNYGVFSARYGNIYTARQLLQLFDRAYGAFRPQENLWREGEKEIIDPFRPNIQPGGFNSEREFALDRDRHFRAVREMFEKLDVFVFTLGLTEAWRSRRDGAVFPICPGVSGGEFSWREHEFVNFGVDDVVADIRAFVDRLRSVNPEARMILTVSPVPLAATAENRHVLVSTVCSKAVLRAACDVLERTVENLVYFPSYEIVASGYAGRYFADDGRTVLEEGVAHVMRVFSRHFLEQPDDLSLAGLARRALRAIKPERRGDDQSQTAAIQAAFQAMCDEEALDLSSDAAPPADLARDETT